MKRDFFDENFEWFLRRQANNFRMEASEKVWSRISQELARRRRRINFSLAALFLLVSGFGYYFISHSIKPIPATAEEKTIAAPPVAEIRQHSTPTPENTIVLQPASKTNDQPVAGNARVSVADPLPQVNLTNSGRIATTEIQNQVAQTLITSNEINEKLQETISETSPELLPASEAIVAETTVQSSETELTAVAEALADQVDLDANYVVYNSVNSNTIKKRKLDWQLSFTPTISYRKLGENKSYLRTAASLSASNGLSPLYSVNSAVTHKPDLGLELGIATKYQLTDHIRIIGGFQFNINRYDIKAFSGPYAVGTIRLNNGGSVSSVNAVTGLSNTGGYRTNWLKNFYFQASAPIGVELKLRGTEAMQFGIATSIQPSYVLGDRAYLITSDYKNYVQMPWLIRRWNANTNLQTFVSYSTGKMRWQVGPQVRYQLLSSFISEYPVKENLFDFGMKVGISLNKQ